MGNAAGLLFLASIGAIIKGWPFGGNTDLLYGGLISLAVSLFLMFKS